MNKGTFIKLVKKYLKGRTSEQEKEFLADYDKLFDEVAASSASGYDAKTLKGSYEATMERIGQQRRGRTAHLRTYRIAAVIALLLVFGFVGYRYEDTLNWLYPEVFSEQTVANGKIGRLTLADGTKVVLNSGSTLKYSSRFNKNSREVFLDGEAYFEVEHDKSMPFVVKTSNIDVQVLGTTFNVRAFEEDGTDEIVVVDGKVAVQSPKIDDKQRVVLFPNEGLRYSMDGRKFERVMTDAETVNSWQHGLLHFRNTPLAVVARALERYYDVKITVGQGVADCPVHAKIEGALWPSLQALSKVLGATVDEKGKHYLIMGKGCN